MSAENNISGKIYDHLIDAAYCALRKYDFGPGVVVDEYGENWKIATSNVTEVSLGVIVDVGMDEPSAPDRILKFLTFTARFNPLDNALSEVCVVDDKGHVWNAKSIQPDSAPALDADCNGSGGSVEGTADNIDPDKVQVVSEGEWTFNSAGEGEARSLIGKDSSDAFYGGLEVFDPDLAIVGIPGPTKWSEPILTHDAAISAGDEMLSEWICGNEDECSCRPRM